MAKRKALGKGLSALIPDADELGGSKEQFFQCPVDAIRPNPDQPRQIFSEDDLQDMINSIREKGVITPLLVSKTSTDYQIIAGERRWRAAQKAGLERIPVVVRETTSTEALELALIENIHRKDLNPIEEANAYKKLMEEPGATQDSVAKHLGKDRSTIANLLRLLNLPVSIQEDVINGRLSMGHARVIAGIKSTQDRIAVRNIVIKKRLSVRQLEALVKKMSTPVPTTTDQSQEDYYIQSLTDNLKRSLGTKVDIKKRGLGGRIVVHFYSDEELDRLLNLLS